MKFNQLKAKVVPFVTKHKKEVLLAVLVLVFIVIVAN